MKVGKYEFHSRWHKMSAQDRYAPLLMSLFSWGAGFCCGVWLVQTGYISSEPACVSFWGFTC